MSFYHPALLYLAPCYAALLLLTFRHRGSRNPHSVVVALLRLLALTAATTALAGPYTTKERPAESILALVDTSASVSETVGEELLRRAVALSQEVGVPLKILPFARTSSPAAIPLERASYQRLRSAWERLDPGATNLELALSSIHGGEGAVSLLLSDGYETVGNILQNSTALAGARIYPLAVPGGADEEAITISHLHAPLTVKAQKSAEIRTTLTNSQSTARSGTLTIKHGDKSVLSKSLTVQPGQDLTAVAQSDPSLEGLNAITATFVWSDKDGEHSVSRTAWLSGEKREKVLLLSGSPDDARYLPQILTNQAYQLRALDTGDDLSALGKPDDYRVVIMNNIPRSAVPASFFEAIPSAVRNGASFVMIGGNKSFGLGGYIDTSIEPILPVKLVPPHTEKKRLNIAVQLVIDKSRSMASENRLEFAKSASSQVLDSLKDDDYLGIIGFDEYPFLALPISPVGQARGIARDRIGRLFPRSKTNLFPALDEARNGLMRVNAGRKHAIVLTDGKIPDAGEYYFDLIRQLRGVGITVSTVLIGDDDDQGFLAQMAQRGGGSFYQTTDPSNLPKIFLSDVKVASGEQTIKENSELYVSAGPSGIISTSLSSFPPLRGFVQTLARDTANTELIIAEGDKAYPLLATWEVGKGHAVAFTSDANGRWSSNWMRWQSINEFWSDILESSLPKNADKAANIPFDARSWLDGGDLVVDLSIFQETGASRITGSIATPLGEERPLNFQNLSQGHYQARMSQPTAGTYKVTMRVGEASLPTIAWTLSGELFGEQPRRQPNIPLLEQIASHSGGKVNPSAQDLKSSLNVLSDKESKQHLFLLIALALLFLEFLVREFRSPRSVT
jgi:Ca-activated chloride channel family protein